MRFGVILQTLSAVLFVVAGWLIDPVVGVGVAAVACLVAGVLAELEGGGRGSSDTGPPS